MSEKIKEILSKSYITRNQYDGEIYYEYEELDPEKFAGMIVRECVSVVDGGGFLHDEAPDAMFAKRCSAAIKRHFGIEEDEK